MSNKPKHAKKNVTKISAGHPANTPTDVKDTDIKPKTNAKIDTKNAKNDANPKKSPKSTTKPSKSAKKSAKAPTEEKPLKQVFLLARPFVAFGRYLRDSWREIRQVRWPGRKLTWKMTFAVLVYCAIFVVFIVLLDTFFTFVFNLLLNVK